MQDEGLGFAVGVDHAVAAGTRDAGDSGPVADAVAQYIGEGLEIPLGPVPAGRVGGGVGRDPAGRREELLGGGVGDLAPGGEEPYMGPVANRGGGGGPRLQDERRDAALDEVGGGGQPDGAGPDDDDGEL